MKRLLAFLALTLCVTVPLCAQGTYAGDIALSTILDVKFESWDWAAGTPTSMAGSPAVSCYKDNGTTESTAGITLTNDFDMRTGFNNLRVDTSADGTFYSAGSNFSCVVTSGTVSGLSWVGRPIVHFSINDRSALRPATAGRTLVVDASGLADANTVKLGPTGSGTAQTARDIGTSVLLSNGTGTGQLKLSSGYISPNWADVGSPTTTLNLSGTTIKTATDIGTATTTTNASLGTWTGTGVNTVLGAFKALARKDASTPSDVGGTFDPSTDSLEAATDNSATLTANGNTNFATFFNNGAASSTAIVDNTKGNKAVPANTAFEWGLGPFRNSSGTIVQTGTPSCTRSIDSVTAFSATSNSPSAVTSNGLSELVISAADTNGTYYMFLKCILAGANDYFQEFKLQP